MHKIKYQEITQSLTVKTSSVNILVYFTLSFLSSAWVLLFTLASFRAHLTLADNRARWVRTRVRLAGFEGSDAHFVTLDKILNLSELQFPYL